jgi:hypothetical protein
LVSNAGIKSFEKIPPKPKKTSFPKIENNSKQFDCFCSPIYFLLAI